MKFRAFIINASIIRRAAAVAIAAAAVGTAAAVLKGRGDTAETFNTLDPEMLMRAELYDNSAEADEDSFSAGRLLEEYSPIFSDSLDSSDTSDVSDSSDISNSSALPSEAPSPVPEQAAEPEPTIAPSPEPTPAPVSEAHGSVGMKLTNNTDFRVNLDELADNPPIFERTEGEPLVLIVHTHTTESYNDVSDNDSGRSTDSSKNMIAVGEVVKSSLEEAGISVVHDTTVHDYPQYNGSYTRALATIKSELQKYPSIQIVLDVHRDAVIKSDGTKVKMTADINGETAAEVMLVVGTNAMGLEHSGWRKNLAFAAAIQRSAEEMYPGLMRPINLRKERFNQHMTRGSLILEVGTSGNDIAEAKAAAYDAAKAIAQVINRQ